MDRPPVPRARRRGGEISLGQKRAVKKVLRFDGSALSSFDLRMKLGLHSTAARQRHEKAEQNSRRTRSLYQNRNGGYLRLADRTWRYPFSLTATVAVTRLRSIAITPGCPHWCAARHDHGKETAPAREREGSARAALLPGSYNWGQPGSLESTLTRSDSFQADCPRAGLPHLGYPRMR
jgi:hypothetical protein